MDYVQPAPYRLERITKMANLVEYVKTVWENGKTALNAARMNNMEQGISDCATQINKLGDSVSRVPNLWGDVVAITCGSWGSGENASVQMQFCLKSDKSFYVTVSKAEGIKLQYGDTGNIKTLWTK